MSAPAGGESQSRQSKVAVASVGDPESRSTWSGVTSGIVGALSELGVTVAPIDLSLPSGAEQALLLAGAARTGNRFDAEGSSVAVRVRSLLARRQVLASDVDGVVQIGSGYILPPGRPYVTLEDMTLRQGAAIHPVFSRMSTRGIAGWERRRALVYAGARTCAAASHWTADSLVSDYGVPQSRVAVVGFGANQLAAASERDWEAPRFLFVGIDWERKGGPSLLRAFARLRERIPAARLDLVGGHPPVSEPGLHAHGELARSSVADREVLAELFARATCLVVPSLVEPFGIVYVEAGSSGIPSIVSAVGGGRDIVGAEGGIVVVPGDEDGLLDAMLALSEPGRARRMGHAARERAALYTWSKVAERLLRGLGLRLPGFAEPAEFL